MFLKFGLPTFVRAVGMILMALPRQDVMAETFEVKVSNFQFSPANLNIKAGDTVRWTWAGGAHSVTSGSSCTPDGGFDTGIKSDTGFSFSRTFTQPGAVPYYCTPHCSGGMTGLISVAAGGPPPAKVPRKLLLQFNTMYGVNGPFIGDQNPLRGVVGDELPWTIRKSATGQLYSNGQLLIQVRGLVHPDDPAVPAELRNTNNEGTLRGLVSCLTEEGDQVVTRNVITQGFPATSAGKVNINARLSLPNPCVAPIVMVIGGSADKWFAATGYEAPQ